jgi:cobalt-precorrin 5A hydrolase
MKTAVVGITKRGVALAFQVGHKLEADIYVKPTWLEDHLNNDQHCPAPRVFPITEDLGTLVGKLFPAYDALVFIMACGIVVRCLAPYIRHKAEDPAVVVTDESGLFAISLLSGHLGGANNLAKAVANITGGTPVITTATDIRQVVAFDEVAKENDCRIENLAVLKYISATLVNGGKIAFYTDFALQGDLPANLIPYSHDTGLKCVVVFSNRTDLELRGEKILTLRPRNLILGIGCRKGISSQQIQVAVEEFMQRNRKSLLSVKTVASLDLKKGEEGLVSFCQEKQLPFRTVSSEVIKEVEHHFSFSPFVKAQVGVGSVAEACAVVSGHQARLISPKTIFKGLTLALAEEEKVINL